MDEPIEPQNRRVAARAFGKENRARLLNRYFQSIPPVRPETAWLDVYRLLLWVDPTTGLAHCYESDKAQPGRPWYPRTLAFHTWLAQQLETTPAALASEIDRLFKWVVQDLAATAIARAEAYRTASERQRKPYLELGVPLPGDDPELVEIVAGSLSDWLSGEIPQTAWHDLARRLRSYIGQENKRKNLVGEGFEDTIAAILGQLPEISSRYKILVRPQLHTIGGFYERRGNEKVREVDIALVQNDSGRRILISCKWSFRSDREEQFTTDFDAYSRLESAGHNFDYVLLTNEFDAARLSTACENRRGPNLLFTSVVHMNPEGPRLVMEPVPGQPSPKDTTGAGRLFGHVASGRLSSLADWLFSLRT